MVFGKKKMKTWYKKCKYSNKICYTKIEADFALDVLSKSKNKKRAESRKYLCSHCNCWHLTSKLKEQDHRNG